ncbi:hypothetical protein C8Q76DRAFT_858874 [Earliella scabrosa]|nr:hypothetical protein C8Q76DRAFT_858874 [Earliella scabrosa]
MSQPPPSEGDVRLSYGAVLLGTLMSIMLYGFGLYQAADYYKLAVKFPSENGLWETVWSLSLHNLPSGIMIIMCQGFYVYRVFKISGRYRTVSYIAIALLFITGAFVIGMHLLKMGEFTTKTFKDFKGWLVTSTFGIAASVNILLTVTLVTYLRANRTDFQRTNFKLESLARPYHHTCFGASFRIRQSSSAVLDGPEPIISTQAIMSSRSLVYIALDSIASQLYVNAVLATINLPLEHTIVTRDDESVFMSAIQLSNISPVSEKPRRQHLAGRSIEISVTREFTREVSGPELYREGEGEVQLETA